MFHSTAFKQPDGTIVDYQKAFHESRARTRMAHGKNRSGKTTAGTAEAVSLCLGFHPWLLPEGMKNKSISFWMMHYEQVPKECRTKFRPPVKGLIIEDDWDTVDEILTVGTPDRPAKLKQFIPDDCLLRAPVKNALGHICRYDFKNGSILRIDTERSFLNDPDSFEGKDLDFVLYDEPKNQRLRNAIGRGLVDSNGDEIFTLTALSEPWLFHEVYQKRHSDPSIQCFFFDTDYNTNISRAGWEAFKKTITDENEYAARIKGEWTFLKGLVYKEFIAKSTLDGGHICKPISVSWVRENGTVWGAIDPHSSNPQTCLLVVADKYDRVFVWREIFKKCLIPDFCEMIKLESSYVDTNELGVQEPRQFEIGGGVFWTDPIAFIEDPVDGRKWADIFDENGVRVAPAPKQQQFGILQTREAFKNNKLFICSNCTRTLWEIQNYIISEWKNTTERNPKEKPRDKDDHTMECLYRLILKNPHYIEGSGWGAPIATKDSFVLP